MDQAQSSSTTPTDESRSCNVGHPCEHLFAFRGIPLCHMTEAEVEDVMKHAQELLALSQTLQRAAVEVHAAQMGVGLRTADEPVETSDGE